MLKLTNLQFFAWSDVTDEGGEKRKVEFAKLESGTMFRILDAEPFSRWVHWVASVKRNVTCIGSKNNCPICNIVREQKANNEVPKYSSSKRHAITIWNYNTKRIEVLDGGNEMFSSLAGLQSVVGDLSTYDLKVIKTGTGKDVKYQFIPQAVSEVSADAQKEYPLFKSEVDFKEYFKAFTYDQLIMILEGKTLEEVFKASEQQDDVPFEEENKEEVSFELED